MTTIGIDPGKNGGIVNQSDSGMWAHKMPDAERLAEANPEIERCEREIARLQRVHFVKNRAQKIADIEAELRWWELQHEEATAQLKGTTPTARELP